MVPKKPRGLNAEEKHLWSRVAETAIPLSPKQRDKNSGTKLVERKVPEQTFDPPRFSVGERSKSNQTRPFVRSDPPSVQMDKKVFKKMSAGRLSPEARIDLHGMTLDRAHSALTGFIMRANAEGQRLVLVITGKGKRRDEGGPIPVRTGVLRQQVPMWLSQAPLSPLILQVSQASQKHGGLGAYYVYLRRNR